MRPVKATPIGDDAVRLLAIPFTGPIPVPGTPGVDMDGQWFSPATDIKASWLPFRPTDWHHGIDPKMQRTVIGKAVDIGGFSGPSREPDEDGWWVTLWLDRGQRRLALIDQLSQAGAAIFGSSETVPGMATVKARDGRVVPWKAGMFGEIVDWPYWRQTLSTSPQNTHSVLRPLKATLDDLRAAGEQPSDQFWTDLEDALRFLGASLPVASRAGRPGAKAGQADLLRAVDRLEAAVARASAISTGARE